MKLELLRHGNLFRIGKVQTKDNMDLLSGQKKRKKQTQNGKAHHPEGVGKLSGGLGVKKQGQVRGLRRLLPSALKGTDSRNTSSCAWLRIKASLLGEVLDSFILLPIS